MRKLMILFYCMLTLLTVSSIQAQTPNYNIRVFGYLNTWALQMGAGVWGSSNYENMLYPNNTIKEIHHGFNFINNRSYYRRSFALAH